MMEFVASLGLVGGVVLLVCVTAIGVALSSADRSWREFTRRPWKDPYGPRAVWDATPRPGARGAPVLPPDLGDGGGDGGGN